MTGEGDWFRVAHALGRNGRIYPRNIWKLALEAVARRPNKGDRVVIDASTTSTHFKRGVVTELDSFGAWVKLDDSTSEHYRQHFVWSQLRVLDLVERIGEL